MANHLAYSFPEDGRLPNQRRKLRVYGKIVGQERVGERERERERE